MNHLVRNLVVVVCLLALGAFGTWIALRPRLPRGDGFTDGEQFLAATAARDELRLARWEPPRPLAQLRDEGRGASAPCLDAASGRLFFARNDDELWLATPEGDGYVTRPLTEINSPRRDTAPAFRDGWLYFASDRPGGSGGLDLWRAPLSGERFLAAENLGAEVNSTADDTDPTLAPIRPADGPPGEALLELWFASNRETGISTGGGDFDLLVAKSDGVRFGMPQIVAAAQSPYDERTPAFSPDGRLLFLASNRPGGAGGFDLWRSLLRGRDLGAPLNLGAPNSPADELGATLGDDGFTLLFASDRAETGRFELLRTRTRELFPVDAPRFTLADFTVLLLLALVALLAWLARRWEALDVLWKCMVVSLLIHLGFLWYSRRVEVEAKAPDFGNRGDAFEIHVLGDILTDVARLEDRARGEEVGADDGADALAIDSGVARSTLALPAAADGAPGEVLAMERGASREPAAAPGASETLRTRGTAISAALQGGGDPLRDDVGGYERLGASAPAIDLAATPGVGGRGEVVVVAAEGAIAPRAVGNGAAGTGASGAGGDARLAAREGAGAPLARSRTSGDGGAAASGTPGRARDPGAATRARGGRETPVVATEGPSDRVASAARRGEGGSEDAPTSLVVGPSPLAGAGAGGDAAGNARGDELRASDGSGSGGTGAGSGPARAGLAIGGSVAIQEGRPGREAPLAGGTASGDGREGDGDGRALARGRSSPLGPSGPQGRGGVPAVAFAMPNEPGRGGGDGDTNSGGRGAAPDLVLAPSTNVGDVGNTGSGGIDGRGDGPRSGLGGGDGRGDVVAAGPVRARLGTGAGLGAGTGDDLSPRAESGGIALPDAIERDGGTDRGTGSGAPAGPEGPYGRLYERRFGDAKKVALTEGGGTAETERAVLAGLKYLAQVQRPKGFFGDGNEIDYESKYRDVRIGKTGLALLAFLGAGHTQRSQTEFSENVARALAWLIARQDAESGHFGNSECYSHGIATYALAECYAMTKDEAIRPPLARALEHLLAMQQRDTGDGRKDGGWTYYYPEGPGFDEFPRASISSWQVMALESAKVGGIAIPDDALAAAKEYFLKSFDPKFGGFRYTHNPSWVNGGYGTLPASTPASMFALTLLGEGDHARVAAAEEYVLARRPEAYRYRGEDSFVRRGQGNIYFMYYSTLALFCRGGSAWREWNGSLQRALLPAQNRDGSWDPIDTYAKNYALDDREDKSYATAMCVLMLEVYYRYFTPLLGKLEAH